MPSFFNSGIISVVQRIAPESTLVHRERIGQNPLVWAVDLAQSAPEKMTLGDWTNVRHQLAIFTQLGNDPYSSASSPHNVEERWVPTEAEARQSYGAHRE